MVSTYSSALSFAVFDLTVSGVSVHIYFSQNRGLSRELNYSRSMIRELSSYCAIIRERVCPIERYIPVPLSVCPHTHESVLHEWPSPWCPPHLLVYFLDVVIFSDGTANQGRNFYCVRVCVCVLQQNLFKL